MSNIESTDIENADVENTDTENTDVESTDVENTEHGGAPSSGRGPAPKVWLAAAGCLVTAALVCAALLWKGPSASPDQGGVSGSDASAPDASASDVTPPRLLGVRDLTVALNETVYYREGVSAEDDVDGLVVVQIDTAAVDLTVPGEYPVVYSAQDAAGNRTEQTITLTVVETVTVDQDLEEPDEDEPAPSGSGGGQSTIPLDQVTQEDVDQLADRILARITNSGMSKWEKARAIYNYVHTHVKYVGTSDKSSWVIGAYVGFTRGRGDCFNYFACSKALLSRAGISNVDLQRVGGTTRHYWQLVNTGDGWYHFDACPHPTGHALYTFMITETRARAFTKELEDAGVRTNYYVYDYASCPVRAVGFPEDEVYPVVDQGTEPQPGENPGGEVQPGENPGDDQPGENPDSEDQPGENPDGENPGGEQPDENPDGEDQPGENPGGDPDPTELPPDQIGEGEPLAA